MLIFFNVSKDVTLFLLQYNMDITYKLQLNFIQYKTTYNTTENGISSGLMGHLARMQTLPYLL